MQISEPTTKPLSKSKETDQLLQQKTLGLVVRMLKQNLPDSLIIQVTGLSKDEIEKIKYRL